MLLKTRAILVVVVGTVMGLTSIYFILRPDEEPEWPVLKDFAEILFALGERRRAITSLEHLRRTGSGRGDRSRGRFRHGGPSVSSALESSMRLTERPLP